MRAGRELNPVNVSAYHLKGTGFNSPPPHIGDQYRWIFPVLLQVSLM